MASVKEATPDDMTTDIVLIKNAGNLMQAVLNTLKTAEAACVKVGNWLWLTWTQPDVS